MQQRENINRYIGQQIKLYRVQRNLSQKQLGEKLSISPQQMQKYEKGIDMLRAADLYVIAHSLNQPIRYFFPANNKTLSFISTPTEKRLKQWNQMYYAIRNKHDQKLIMDIAKVIITIKR